MGGEERVPDLSLGQLASPLVCSRRRVSGQTTTCVVSESPLYPEYSCPSPLPERRARHVCWNLTEQMCMVAPDHAREEVEDRKSRTPQFKKTAQAKLVVPVARWRL